jgi:hypothetical protein
LLRQRPAPCPRKFHVHAESVCHAQWHCMLNLRLVLRNRVLHFGVDANRGQKATPETGATHTNGTCPSLRSGRACAFESAVHFSWVCVGQRRLFSMFVVLCRFCKNANKTKARRSARRSQLSARRRFLPQKPMNLLKTTCSKKCSASFARRSFDEFSTFLQGETQRRVLDPPCDT